MELELNSLNKFIPCSLSLIFRGASHVGIIRALHEAGLCANISVLIRMMKIGFGKRDYGISFNRSMVASYVSSKVSSLLINALWMFLKLMFRLETSKWEANV